MFDVTYTHTPQRHGFPPRKVDWNHNLQGREQFERFQSTTSDMFRPATDQDYKLLGNTVGINLEGDISSSHV